MQCYFVLISESTLRKSGLVKECIHSAPRKWGSRGMSTRMYAVYTNTSICLQLSNPDRSTLTATDTQTSYGLPTRSTFVTEDTQILIAIFSNGINFEQRKAVSSTESKSLTNMLNTKHTHTHMHIYCLQY